MSCVENKVTRIEEQRLDTQIVMELISRLHQDDSILEEQAMRSCHCKLRSVFLADIEGVTLSTFFLRNIVIIDWNLFLWMYPMTSKELYPRHSTKVQ